MANLGNQIGISGKARQFGIIPVGTTASWTGFSGTSRTAVVVNKALGFTPDCDTQDTKDAIGQFQGRRGVNHRASVKIELEPIGTATSDAAAIALDPPRKNSLITLIGPTGAPAWCAATTGTAYLVTNANASFSPEGAATLSVDAEAWFDDSNALIALTTYTVT